MTPRCEVRMKSMRYCTSGQASERSPAGLYREMIVYDPDGVLVSVMQIDPLPEQAH